MMDLNRRVDSKSRTYIIHKYMLPSITLLIICIYFWLPASVASNCYEVDVRGVDRPFWGGRLTEHTEMQPLIITVTIGGLGHVANAARQHSYLDVLPPY
jgi:hypothetical protein